MVRRAHHDPSEPDAVRAGTLALFIGSKDGRDLQEKYAHNRMVQCLFLDIATNDGLIACVTRESIRASQPLHHCMGDHELVPLLETTLHEALWTYQNLTQLACVVGPGGFTSLRIGTALINALAWGLKIPVAGIHLSDLCEARATRDELRGTSYESSETEGPPYESQSFLWLHSTKRTELFVRGFGELAKQWPAPICIGLEALLCEVQKTKNKKLLLYAGELLPEHRERLHSYGLVSLVCSPLPEILPTFLASRSYSQKPLLPWYGRGW